MLTAVVPEEAPPDHAVVRLSERLRLQEQQLEKQRHGLAEVKEQLATVLAELRQLKGQAPDCKVQVLRDTVGKTVSGSASLESTASDGIPSYSFDESMWDAVVMIFFKDITMAEKAVLFAGFLVNLTLQTMLLLVVRFDMLENEYERKVEEMVLWRVEVGHSDSSFDRVSGKSLISNLCARKLWSYEQDQYQEMYNYLYEDVPGIVLSILAIVLWVLTSLVEYRQVTEQALALMTLPSNREGADVRMDSEEIEIVAIRPGLRWGVLLTVCLPRFVVLVSLCIVGCQYLAQTASLHDIVLNAVALAFVMDVDELLCLVLLPQRLRGILEKVQPLPCGTKKSWVNKRIGGFVLKDLIRYFLLVTAVVVTIIVYLVPFHDKVVGAATALCGGKHDFTYSGGIVGQPTVALKNTSDYVTECSDAMMDAYVGRFYGSGYNVSSGTKMRKAAKATGNFDRDKLEAVYNYAFKGCPAGMVLSPAGFCVTVPSTLTERLPSTVRPGETADPAQCSRLNPRMGASACDEQPDPKACLWSWGSQICENDSEPPGDVHSRTCSEELSETCDMWESFFNRAHPTKNCRILDVCPGEDTSCFSILGRLQLDVRNKTAFEANETLTEASVKAGLGRLAGVETDSIEVLKPRRPPSNSTTEDMYYAIYSLPVTVKPSAVLRSAVKLAKEINNGIAEGLGSNDTVSAVSFIQQEFLKESEVRALWMSAQTLMHHFLGEEQQPQQQQQGQQQQQQQQGQQQQQQGQPQQQQQPVGR